MAIYKNTNLYNTLKKSGYHVLCLNLNQIRKMRIITNCPDYYHVEIDEIAISQNRLKTSGLATCVGLAITQGEQKLLSHVTATSPAQEIAQAIKKSFDVTHPMKVTIINGSLEAPDRSPATRICVKALKMAGVESDYDFASVNGGFMATVNLLHNHIVWNEKLRAPTDINFRDFQPL